MKQWKWRHFILFLLAIPILNYFAGYLGKSTAHQINEREAPSTEQSTSNQQIQVFVSSQDSEGVTQQNFDMKFLKNLEVYTLERVKIKTKEYLASQGYPNADVNFTSEAIYIESGPVKLAVIRLKAPEGSNQVFIAGIIGSELKRVACTRSSAEKIPITYGVCAEKIEEVFGFKIKG